MTINKNFTQRTEGAIVQMAADVADFFSPASVVTNYLSRNTVWVIILVASLSLSVSVVVGSTTSRGPIFGRIHGMP